MNKKKSYIGLRFLAGFIDYAIVFVFFYMYVTNYGIENEDGEYSVSGIMANVPILFWLVWTVGVEQLLGATFGNIIFDLEPKSLVKNKLEEKITFGQSLKRHLLDPIDMFLFGFIAYISIKNSDTNQRIGDVWAKTTVVKAKKKVDK